MVLRECLHVLLWWGRSTGMGLDEPPGQSGTRLLCAHTSSSVCRWSASHKQHCSWWVASPVFWWRAREKNVLTQKPKCDSNYIHIRTNTHKYIDIYCILYIQTVLLESLWTCKITLLHNIQFQMCKAHLTNNGHTNSTKATYFTKTENCTCAKSMWTLVLVCGSSFFSHCFI